MPGTELQTTTHAGGAPAPAAGFTMGDLDRMATWVVESRLFGNLTKPAASTLLLLCQAEGLHPIMAMRRYHLIQNRPSMRADAMLAEFQRQGGRIAWGERTDERAEATFSHPAGGTVTIAWTIADAKRAGVFGSNAMWTKYPRQMLTARVISEGVRTVLPGVVAGVYTPEEVQDFDDDRPRRGASPARAEPPRDPEPEPEPEPPAEVLDADGLRVLALADLPECGEKRRARWNAWFDKLMAKWAEVEPLPDGDDPAQARAREKELVSRSMRIMNDLVTRALAGTGAWRLDEASICKVGPNGAPGAARDTRLCWQAVHRLAQHDWEWVKAASLDHIRKFAAAREPEPAAVGMTDAEAREAYGPGAS